MWRYSTEESNGQFMIVARLEVKPVGSSEPSSFAHLDMRVWSGEGWRDYLDRERAKLYDTKTEAEQAIDSGLPQPA